MRRVALSYKLILLIAFPLLMALAVGFYAIKDFEKTDHRLLFIGAMILLGAYLPVAIIFVRKLSRSLVVVENTSAALAAGKVNGKINLSDISSIKNVGNSINMVIEDLHRQSTFAEQIRAGNLDATYKPRHDHDVLGRALVSIKDNLIAIKKEEQQRNWASEGLTKFVAVLQSAKDLKALSNDIIVTLVRILNANQGVLFVIAKDETEKEFLEMQACYAFSRTKHLTQKVAPGEGLIGQAFLDRGTVYLKDVPDHFVRITSGLGEANPKHVLIVPLKTNETIIGIVELASFEEFSKHEIAFVEKIGESIAYTFSSIQIAENTKKLLDESNAHAEQLRAQEEELRQNQEELQATQETISRKYDALFKQLSELNYQSRFDQLKSITSTKKRNIEYYFDIIRNQIHTFSENRMVIEATKTFKGAFYKVAQDVTAEQTLKMKENLKLYYTTEFIQKLNENSNANAKASEYMPEDVRALTFQYLFISNNRHPTGKKSLLDDAEDGSEYSRVHALYHPIFRNFLEKFGYYDIFLIDALTGDMIYSVFKEVDFATNLVNGRYHISNFGKVVKKVMESVDKDFVQLIDFEPYDPSYHAPASFIACPIYEGENKIGILVFQMPINKINQILTGNHKWREDGLGDSGETIIVGEDYKLRSISRELIEDPSAHLSALKKLKYDDLTLQQIRTMETNILLEEIKQESVAKALSGLSGTQLEYNTFGVNTLTAFAPLEIPDVHWVIISTMKEEEASSRINHLREENA